MLQINCKLKLQKLLISDKNEFFMELTLRAAFGVISRLPKAEECDLRESLTEAE